MRSLTYEGLQQILAKAKLETISPGLRFGLFFNGWTDDDYKPESKKKLEALTEISDNPDLSASMFISDVRAMIEEYNTVPAEPANDYIEGD